MSKIVLDDVISGYGLSKINENFQKVQDELNNKVLYRDNPDGEPNTLEQDLDVNGFSLYNIDKLNGVVVDTLTANIDIVVDNISDINTVATNIDNVNIVAGIDDDVTTVANISEDVSTLAPYAPDINGYTTGIYANLASSDAGKGAELIEYQGSTVENALNNRLTEFANYEELDEYTGALTSVYIRGAVNTLDGGHGVFRRTTETPSGVNGVYRQDGSGRWWKRDFVGAASLKWFGAIADGVADDTAAVLAAITSGYSLDWGGVECTYKVVGGVNASISHPINWISHGAKIVQGAASVQQFTISIDVQAFNHRIDGELNIDAAMKSYIGIRIQKLTNGTTYPTDYANFYANGLKVKNTYRSGTTYNLSAEGISIRGPFDSIVLENPVIFNSVLASGAGVAGSYGCYGISISENSYGQPIYVQIKNPHIDSVYCEDNTYYFDQDGIRFIASNTSTPSEPTLRVTGGKIRDCWGRGIKSQVENTIVDGTRFIRAASGFARGYGNQDIDFQEGGGQVVNIQCLYTGHTPSSVVNFSTTRQAGKISVPFGSIDGIQVVIGSGKTLEKVFVNTVWSDVTKQVIRASKIEVRGAGSLTYFCEFLGGNSGDGFHLLLADNAAAPTNEWVFCPSVTGTGTIKAIRQINTGASSINFRRSNSTTWRPVVSARDCIGFNEASSADNDVSVQGVVERVSALAGTGTAFDGGMVRVYSYTLALNQIQALPSGGGNNNNGLMLISAYGAQMSGVFTRDTTGAYALAAGTNIVAGTTSEPATGQHRVWYDTTLSQHVLKNVSGNPRVYTVVLIG